MKKLAFAAIALFAIGAAPALAADMAPAPYTKAPPPVVPVFTWTGFYVGGNAGYAWGNSDPTSLFTCPSGSAANSCAYSFPANLAVIDNATTGRLQPDGFTGGFQAGYNWQFASSAVFGIETDINSFRLRSSLSATGPFPAAASNFVTNVSSSTDWLYTLRGRLGWAFTPMAMLYATGGLAVTDLHTSNAFTDNFAPPTFGSSSISNTKAGWTAGGGVEWAFNQNWTVKAEYLYVDFGSVSTTLTTNTIAAVVGPNVLTTSTNLHENIVRAGINYKFGGPVVARY
jgi:outer membrane immunogenic protein